MVWRHSNQRGYSWDEEITTVPTRMQRGGKGLSTRHRERRDRFTLPLPTPAAVRVALFADSLSGSTLPVVLSNQAYLLVLWGSNRSCDSTPFTSSKLPCRIHAGMSKEMCLLIQLEDIMGHACGGTRTKLREGPDPAVVAACKCALKTQEKHCQRCGDPRKPNKR